MALNPYWKGFLKLSLVSIPVKGFKASVSDSTDIHFNQLHADCHSRIQYKKTCPIHAEVGNDEIVSGFEYSRGQYVIVDPAEVDKLRSEDDKAITISAFIPPDALDPIYLTGKTYYLVPDALVGQKPYAVFYKAMAEENRWAVGQVVLHGREQVVLVRPLSNLLAMTVLSYANQIVKASTLVDLAPATQPTAEELELTKKLIRASTPQKFDFGAYKDVYTEKLTKLIEGKVVGQEVVAPPAPAGAEPAHIINLMDALRASVEKTQKKAAEASKPPKRMAPSKGKEMPARRRKTS